MWRSEPLFCPPPPVTTDSSACLYRYRLDHGTFFPSLRWSKQQSHHALDVDHQPGQQILDTIARLTAIARLSTVVLPHHLGQFPFDRPMFSANLSVARRGRFLAGGRVLGSIIVHNHNPAIRFGEVLETACLQRTRCAVITWKSIFPAGVHPVARAPLCAHPARAGQGLRVG
jgi:hypothetical protein